MKPLYIITIMLVILILPVVSAECSFVFQKDDIINLNVPVTNSDNSMANSSTTCNITIRDSDENIVIQNQIMSFNAGGIYNYTMTNNTDLGEYPAFVSCTDGGDSGFSSFCFEITPSGLISSTGDSILYSLFSVILFGIISLFTFFTFTMPSKNEKDERGFENKIIKLKYIRMIFIALIYGLSIVLLNFLNGLAVNFSSLSFFSGILGFMFETMLRLAWPFTVILLAWIVVMLVHDSNLNKQLKKLNSLRLGYE